MSMNPKKFASAIRVGSVVSIFGEDWLHCGTIKIYDGDSTIERVMLSNVHNPSLYTFVHPMHQFSLYQGTYSDSEEFPL